MEIPLSNLKNMLNLVSLLNLVIVSTLLTVVTSSHDAQKTLLSDFVCDHPPYKIRKVSASPLIIYIEDFLTVPERAHLKSITCDMSPPSPVRDLIHPRKPANVTSQQRYVPTLGDSRIRRSCSRLYAHVTVDIRSS